MEGNPAKKLKMDTWNKLWVGNFCYGDINPPFPGDCCFLRDQEILAGLHMAQTLALYPVTLEPKYGTRLSITDNLHPITPPGATKKTNGLLFSRAGEK